MDEQAPISRRTFIRRFGAVGRVRRRSGTPLGADRQPPQAGRAAAVRRPRCQDAVRPHGDQPAHRRCNPFYGYAHFNSNAGRGDARVLHGRARLRRAPPVWRGSASTPTTTSTSAARPRIWTVQAEGGNMHLIIQGMGRSGAARGRAEAAGDVPATGNAPTRPIRRADRHGARLVQAGARPRLPGGVGTHKPKSSRSSRSRGGTWTSTRGVVYNRTRTADEWRKVLNGE